MVVMEMNDLHLLLLEEDVAGVETTDAAVAEVAVGLCIA